MSGVTFESYNTKVSFKSRTVCSAWHSEVPILAVSTVNGVVSCYNDEGENIEEMNLSRSIPSTAIAWHPVERILCTGWKDGEIHVYNNVDHSVKAASQGNSDVSHLGNAITAIKWTPDGKRMITADSSGVIGIWELNNRGKVVIIAFHSTERRVTQLTTDQIAFKKTTVIADNDPNTAVDNWFFFFTTDDGKLLVADDTENYRQTAIDFRSHVSGLLFHERTSALICITLDSVLYILDVSNDLKIHQRSKTKVSLGRSIADITSDTGSAKSKPIQVAWVGRDLIATLTNEKVIRVWNLETDDHCVLTNESKVTEPLLYFSFNPLKRSVVAITAAGSLYFWNYVGNSNQAKNEEKSSDDWEPYASYETGQLLAQDVSWGPGEEFISVSYEDHSTILHESSLKKKMRGKLIAIQSDIGTISLVDAQTAKDPNSDDKQKDEQSVRTVKCKVKIKQLDLTENMVAVSSGKQVELYEVKESLVRIKLSLDQSSQCIGLHDEYIFLGTGPRIEVYNLSGTKKQTINFSNSDGIPTHIDVKGDYIAVGTRNNRVKLFQASGREAKQVSSDKKIFEEADVMKEAEKSKEAQTVISDMRCNCNGTKIAVLARTVQNYRVYEPSTILYIYDLEQDKVDSFDFASFSQYPISLFWDQIEPKLLAVETKRFGEVDGKDESITTSIGKESSNSISVCTLFATPDHGVQLQDTINMEKNLISLVGLEVPNLYYKVKEQKDLRASMPERRIIVSKKSGDQIGDDQPNSVEPTSSTSSTALIERRALRDFEGINIKDSKTRDALLLFSYYLTIGNMEEAYKSVKQIKDASVWSNMAQMCVKTKKMDVAEICLGNMLDATAARALREAKQQNESQEAQIAILAIHLGLHQQAEELYIQSKRYDLLNKFYQALGYWNKALQIASTHDRVHLRTTHYQYARYLESLGDFKGAAEHYEISNNHHYEVPRMLMDARQLNELERYVNGKVQLDDINRENGVKKPVAEKQFLSNNKDDVVQLLRWWAQYCEGNSDFENAIQYYTKANDVLAQVRLYCLSGNLKKAADIVKKSGDKASAYYLARQLELGERIDYAIKFYKQAGVYQHAIRIAKEKDLAQDVLHLALQSSQRVMIDAARYFEEKNMMDKAVLLYQKGGKVSLAIDLCFKGQLFDVLSDIADELASQDESVDVDIQMLEKCGDFFVQHGQYDKAVLMYTRAKLYVKALELCASKNVNLTEDLAESLTPPKPDDNSSGEYKKKRIIIIKKIAKLAAAQNNFKISTKKYIQAGDNQKAMRVLIKSGETEKIVAFAKLSRQRELYILAANYLQNLDYHRDPELVNDIVALYTKVKAWTNLATFHESCSQMEIDEFRNYEKALDALKDAMKYLAKEQKQNTTSELTERIAVLKHRIALVQKFIVARSLFNGANGSPPNDIVSLCIELLNEPQVHLAIRVGDIYALLVEWFWSRNNDPREAYSWILKMKEEEIELSYYLEPDVIRDIFKENGIEYDEEHEDGMEDEIEEDIVED